MTIDFKPDRWKKVKETYRRWWAGELQRPIVAQVLTGRNPGRPQPRAPILSQATCADLTISVEDVIDRMDYEFSKRVYLGDAFPILCLDEFGPGIAAAFLGARLDNSTGRVWFHAPSDTPIEDLHFRYDSDNVWLRRIKDICAAAMTRWQGQVMVNMPDLGGPLDILSTFRPSEKLLIDLIDSPEEVKRLVWELHDLWHRFYAEINAVLQPANPGYSAWCQMFSDLPYYILQCDFSYMISPEMFREFVRDELEASSRRLSRCFYHLDGRGQLPHMDMILAMERVNGVQWVSGEGAPSCMHWPDVYRRIFAAGKKTWMGRHEAEQGRPLEPIRWILKEVGLGPGIYYRMPLRPLSDEKKCRQELASLGFEE